MAPPDPATGRPKAADRLPAIFAEALEQPPAERAAFLDNAAGDDPALRAEIEALLAAHPEATRFFDGHPPLIRLADLPTELGDDDTGVQVGPYRLLEEIARGGMGTVYLGERVDRTYEKRVAIKLIRPGLLDDDGVARFRTERQVLADLEHPGIARLIDGGTTDDGRPWLAMEFVEGETLTRHAALHELNLDHRLELFVAVCEAVQYAHQHLVVHRDLKPGNILIDRSGRVKLLDFGIAKVLDASRPGNDHTRAGVPPFTARYASPEQVNGGRITTTSDIYSLGVILYELLTGQFPYDVKRASTTLALVEMLATARPVPPSRASTIVPPRRLAGDLDTVILRALAKEPERRYATVDEFAADIRRFQRGRPVAARPDTAMYRFSRFVRRNRLFVSGAVVAAVLLLAAWFGTFRAWREATSSRGEARLQAYVGSLAAAEASLLLDKVVEAAAHLEAAPAERRGWEWNHLAGRLDRSLAARMAHRAGITSLTMRDSLLVTTSIDSTVRIWRGSGPEPEEILGPFASGVETAALLPGHREVALGLTDGAVLLATRGGGAIRTLSPAGRQWALVALSPDGRHLAAGFFDGHVRTWRMPEGTAEAEWRAHDQVTIPSWSPDGRYLATGGADGRVALHDAGTYALVRRLHGHERRVYSLAWSPDGSRLATGSLDKTAVSWDVATGRPLATFRGHRGTVAALTFTADGRRIVSSGSDYGLVSWDAATGAQLASFRGHRADVSAVTLDGATGRLITGDWRGFVRRWADDTEDVHVLRVPGARQLVPAVTDLAIDGPRGRVVGAVNLNALMIWRLDEVEPSTWLRGITGHRLAITPDGRSVLGGSEAGSLVLFDDDGHRLREATAHAGPVNGLAIHPDGATAVTGSTEGVVRRWSLPDLATMGIVDSLPSGILDLAYAPDGDRLAAGSDDGSVTVWDARTGSRLAGRRLAEGAVQDVAFNPTGRRIAAACADGTIRIWDPAAGTERVLRGAGSPGLTAVAWSGTADRLAAGGVDEIVRLFDPSTGRELLALHGHVGRITALGFTPGDAALLSSSTDGTIRCWESGAVRGLP